MLVHDTVKAFMVVLECQEIAKSPKVIPNGQLTARLYSRKNNGHSISYSTVTDFAKFLGLSTSVPRVIAA